MKKNVRVLGQRVPDTRGVRLDAAANDNAAPAVWLEVAYEGTFKGHWMGEFEFTEATFDEIIANFHAHPGYEPGADAAPAEDIDSGKYDVVQWDMHHASEAPATSGEIAVIGAPAQGWVLDVRKGRREDGKVKLEALTRWLEPARTYVREKRYRWASVSVVFNAKDPEKGTPIGAVLTSIAVTNQPFLQDLPALAASAQLMEWYGDARTPEDAFGAIRGRLGLPATATVADAAAEVAKLRGYTAPGATVPAGVDVNGIVSCFRGVLELPLLSTNDEVFAELDKLFTQLAPAGATTEETVMTTNASSQPAAKSPADDLRDSLAVALAKHRKCDAKDVTNLQILAAVEGNAAATTDLAALFEALDVANLGTALAQIDTLKKIQKKLNEVMPAYEAAQEQLQQIDEADALEDVGMALASMGFDANDPKKANLRMSLMNHRKSNKDEFRKQYNTEEARRLSRAHNSATVATTGGIDPTLTLATQRQHTAPAGHDPFAGMRVVNGQIVRASAVQDKPGAGAPKIDLSAYQGVNDLQRAVKYLRAQPGGDKLSTDDVHTQAAALVARLRGKAA